MEVKKGSKAACDEMGAGAVMICGSLNLEGVLGGGPGLLASSSKPPRRSVVEAFGGLEVLLGVVEGEDSAPPAETAPPMQYGCVSKL